MTVTACPLPTAGSQTGLQVLKGLAHDRSLLTALALMNRHVGSAFKITMPRFQPAVFVGPDSNRQIMVTGRHAFHWRNEGDPVVKLLRHGVLVLDGQFHASFCRDTIFSAGRKPQNRPDFNGVSGLHRQR